MATYYVDNAGSNGAAGTSPATAWQTCAKVNATALSADDQIVFTAGQTFTGPLTVTNNGTSGHYICFGTGRLTGATAGTTRTAQSSPATITCPDGSDGIQLTNCEYVSLDNLIVSGSGVNTTNGSSTSTGVGIHLASTQATNKLNGLRVTACTVTGCKDGIFIHTSTGSQKGYADLQIWGAVVHACQRIGILMNNNDGTFGSGAATQNSDIYIGTCQVYDLPGKAGGAGIGNCGEGITVDNCTGGTVEYCVVHDLNIIGNQGPGGTQGLGSAISNGIVFQFNEVYRVFAPSPVLIDGAGIDFETKAVSCIAQYNYIHDCEGAGYLTGSQNGITNNNIIRFNVFARNASVNQAELYSFNSQDGSAVSSTCYCNTIYASHGNAYDNAGGYATKSADALVNNILVSAAGAFCVNGTISTSEMFGNLYYAIGGGGIQIRPNGVTYTSMSSLRAASYEVTGGSSGVNADPLLDSPTTSTTGSLPDRLVATVNGFDLGVLSPARNAGVDISGIVTLVQDFHGLATTTAGANIGATISPVPRVHLPVRIR